MNKDLENLLDGRIEIAYRDWCNCLLQKYGGDETKIDWKALAKEMFFVQNYYDCIAEKTRNHVSEIGRMMMELYYLKHN